MNYPDILKNFKRVAICGGPKTGKTTLSNTIPHELVVHTDEYMNLSWEEVPPAIIARLTGCPSFVIEGVQVPRVLRKGLEVDCVVYLERTWLPLTPPQRSLTKACFTVFGEWRQKHRHIPLERL